MASLLQEYVNKHGTNGLNKGYVESALKNGGGYGATAGGIEVDESGYRYIRPYNSDGSRDRTVVIDRVYNQPGKPTVTIDDANKWFDEAFKLFQSMDSYGDSNKDSYNRDYGSSYSSQIADMMASAKGVEDYLNTHRNEFGNFDEVFGALKGYQEALKQYDIHGASVRNYYSQWDTEEEYSYWLEGYNRKQSNKASGISDKEWALGAESAYEKATDELKALEHQYNGLEVNRTYASQNWDGGMYMGIDNNKVAMYDAEMERLKKEIEVAKQRQLDAYQDLSYATAYRFSEYTSMPDFSKKSAEGLAAYEAEKTGQGTVDSTMFADTSTAGGTFSIAFNQLRNDTEYKEPTESWTEEQKALWGYLRSTDKEEADVYAIQLNNAYNSEKRQADEKKVADWSTKNSFNAALATAGSIAATPFHGVEYLADIMEYNARGTITEKAYMGAADFSNTVTGAISEELNTKYGTLDEGLAIVGGKGWGDAYQLGTSVLQSTATVLAGGQYGSLAIFFGTAAKSGLDNALDRGATPEQALMVGFTQGLAEVLMEKFSVEGLLDILKKGASKSIITDLIKQGGIEASEEMFTSIANNITDGLIMGDKSNLNGAINSYMAEGMSYEEAKKQAYKDQIEHVAFDALGGFVSGMGGGVTMSGVGSAVSHATNYKGDSEALLTTAKESGNDELMKLAEEMSGKRMTNARAGKLLEGMTNADTQSIAKAAENQLQSLGEKGDTKLIASAIAKTAVNTAEQQAGAEVSQSLTKAETEALKASKYGQRILNELNAENILSGEYRSGWTGSINTTRVNSTLYGRDKTIAKIKEELAPKSDVKAPVERTLEASEEGKTTLKDGTEVSIKKIASIKDGAMTLELEDGSTVDSKDVLYASDNEALVYETVARMDINPEAATKLVQGYNAESGMSAEVYSRGIQEAYRYGMYNIPVNEMLERGSFSKDLDAVQRNTAYRLGQIFGGKTVAKQQAIIKKAQAGAKATKAEGKVHFDGDRNALTERQSASLAAIEKIADALGIQVYVFESQEVNGKRVGANGWFDPKDSSIHIDLFAGQNGESTMLFTASHELVHFIRKWSPAKFKVLANFLMEQYGKKGISVDTLVHNQIAKAKQNGRTISYDTAYEEVIADSMETMLTDGKVAEKLALLKERDQSLWEKIKEFFSDLMAKVQKAYEGMTPNSAEGRYVAEMKDSLERLQELFAEGLVEASENFTIGSRNMEDFAAAQNTEGESLFQYRAMEADEDIYRGMLQKWGKMSNKQIDNLFSTIDKAMDIIKDNLEALDYAWEADIDDRAFSPVKPNSDSLYQVSLDFSTLCRKRLLQQTVQAQLQEALNQPLTREEGIAIRDALMAIQKEGRQIEVACALCYVESARMKSPAQIKKFMNNRESVLKNFFASKNGGDMKAKIAAAEAKVRAELGVGDTPLKKLPGKAAKAIRDAKKAAKASYAPTAAEQKIIDTAKGMAVSDFTSPEGLENLAKNHPELFDAYTSYIRNATKSKGIESDTWWRAGDSEKIGDTLIANMNRENGLRSQSWSDFQVIHLLDYIAATIELSTRNAKEQAYSKVPDYVELMGQTGVMINMSLIPTRDFNGSLEYDSVEGIDYKRSLELRDKYPATAGTICIGVGNQQIKLLLADGTIDYVIPYHRSGMAAHIRKAMHIPTWDEYQDYQSEKKLSRAEAEARAAKYGVKLLDESDPKYQKHTSFSEWFNLQEAQQIAKMENAHPSDKTMQKKYGIMYGGYMAMQNAGNNYLKLCAERGLAPKFSYGKADFSGEANYWKLLIDRKMVNNATGEIIEQQTIKPIFDEAEVLRILNDELERYPKVKADQDYATRRVTEKFLSGEVKGGMSAEAIAEVIKKPVDNVTTTNIAASAEDIDMKSMARRLTSNDLQDYLKAGNRKNVAKQKALEDGKDIVLTSDDAITDYIVDSISSKEGLPTVAYGKVTERLAEDTNQASHGKIDITDNYLELVSYDIGHAYEQHITAKEEGDIDLSLDDFKNIPNYVDEYDEVVYAIRYGSGTTRICLSKKVADGRVLIIETVSKSRGALQFKNMIGVTEEKYESDYINVYKKGSSSNPRGGQVPNISLRDESTSEAIIQQKSEEIKRSDRNPDSMSNRSLLANALESVAQNDIERNKIEQYKEKIELINAEEKKLQELRAEIKELSFAKGPKDTARIRKLQDEATMTANRINTYDRQLLRLEASKPLQAVLEREKAMAKKKAEQKGKEALAAYREKTAQTQRELLERVRESRKNAKEGRDKTAMRHKIKDIVNELNTYLLKGNKDKHVMIGLQKAVASALDAVNMDTVGAESRLEALSAKIAKEKDPIKLNDLLSSYRRIMEQGEKMSEKLANLKAAYADIKNSDDPLIANSHDEVIEAKIEAVVASVGETPLKEMSLQQLEDVYDLYKMVLTTIRNSNKAFKAAKGEEISVLGNNVMMEVEAVGGKKKLRLKGLEGLSKFVWNNFKPVYAFKTIGSKTLSRIFDSVRAGEDVWARDVAEARAFFLEQSKKYGYDSWNFEETYSFKSSSGMDFHLNLEQIMSLYAYSKREQALDHLQRGGIVFDEATEVTVKTKLGIPLKFNPTEATAYNISPETLADITSKLTKEQAAFADAMQEYLSTTMGEKGNEVSLEMYGVKLFKEKFYFPLKSATQYMAKAKEQQKGEVKIKNSGFSKGTVQKANNPIVLTPFMNVWAEHVNDMSMYHAFVLPMEDFYRVFNYRTPTSETMATESVEMYIQNAYGKGATAYIEQLLKDLNGGARSDPTAGFINKMMGLFKKGAVFASASVVIQQPSAIARAMALVDSKYFVGKKMDSHRHEALWEEVKQYAPVAMIKEMGYFDTNMGMSTVDFIKAKEYDSWGDKMKGLVADGNYRDEWLSKAPALADEIAWCQIWEAVKRETAAQHKGLDAGSEAFLKLAGERFTEVIVNTQVYDSVLSRSGNMRSKDTGMKMATAFLAEPTTTINMIADALVQGKRGDKKYARAAIGAAIASQILNSILVSFVYAARDDDEDESYWEKYLGTLAGEIKDSFNLFTYIPFIKDIVSIVQGYDVERSDISIISDLWKAYEQLDSDKISPYRKVENFAGSIAQIFGLPVKNILRDARGLYQTVDSFLNGPQTTRAGIKYAVKGAVTGKDVSDGQQLYEAMMAGDTAHAERVKARFKDQAAADSAIRKALRENDPRIHEAAVARHNGDIAEYTRIAKEIIAEGHFKQDYVVSAISTEMNTLDKEEKESSTNTKVSGLYKTDDFTAAVMGGDSAMANAVRADIIRTSVANGKTQKDAEEAFASSASSSLKEEFMEGRLSETKAIQALVSYCGKDKEAAEKRVDEWAFEAEYGFAYSDRKDAYISGEISANEMRKILMDVEGMDAEEVDAQIEVYDWQAEGYEDATEARIREYYEHCEAYYVPKDIYLEIRKIQSNTNNDKDENGKSISYSAMKKIMAVIDSYDLSAEQKDAVARSIGWSEKNINKYKLW